MTVRFVVLFILLIGATAFSQTLSLQSLGDSFRCSPKIINWNAPTNSLPATVWVYHILPKKFPPNAISNLVVSLGLTAKDRVVANNGETVYLNSPNFPSKQLEISETHGSIHYESVTDYGPTNLAKDVPEMNQLMNLTTNFLSQFDIDYSEIDKTSNGAPNLHYWEPFKENFLKNGIVTNIEFRAVVFRRYVDGNMILGAGTAGNGEIFFGEHAKPVKIDIFWPNLGRYKDYPTASPETITKWIAEGKAVHGGISMNLPDIDWSTIKSISIDKAEICYNAGDRFSPSEWLMPLVSLWTTVDTGQGNVNVEIDCPIIDDGK